jgi:Domain of unknown function (DUF4265)
MKRSEDGKLVVVTFDLDPADWHGRPSEGLWAEPIGGGMAGARFRLHNAPFFATGVSYLDTVRARPADDRLEFAGVVERGGHSTYMLLVPPASRDFATYWRGLETRGCTYESKSIRLGMGPRMLYSVDVPPSSDFAEISAILDQGERDKVWEFQEGHSAHRLNSRRD